MSFLALKRWLRTVDSRQPRTLAISAEERSSIWFMTKIVFCFGERPCETALKTDSISFRCTTTDCSASVDVFTSRRFELTAFSRDCLLRMKSIATFVTIWQRQGAEAQLA